MTKDVVDLEIDDEEITSELIVNGSRFPPIPAKTYEFMIDEITIWNTSEGRPRWLCWLKVFNEPTLPYTRLPYAVYLPWINPQMGQWDLSFGFLLTNLMKGTGREWVGDFRKPEVQEEYRKSLIGATGFMRVGQKAKREDSSKTDNTLVIIAAKK
jgi:hypothetical protein